MTVRLEKMNSVEFQQYLSYAIKNFADEQIKSGIWEQQGSISRAKNEYIKLLPEGEKTENNNLFTIRDGDQEVGMIWLAQRTNEKGFIYDINIWEGNQGKGYGKQAMKELEIAAKKIGLKSIGLHVFGHNKVARDLYEKLGYIETNIRMEKTL
ncbi:GNAT family N-acetyltransferase [Aquibacillus sp. 3ASR75-11]|uniref:GNAT family N-acetyltransferase n=1 Tax=Terrihalobacillus insolitus TaxID=2950438 RepID=A0A9X4AMJ2_9BACI|nr:GNAT family N-acetyltransferase [Terrihalobacillus insolitus]MDC3414160.1 GNAT family N-acetyltransferase [Terrihalobacillus insolitus]MDC3425366.1 GNAT family N-acetyltransferase [Terrihalobacillus insolitus]